ncbi:hypothetical protein PR048_012036 [Dryococelus australis]|uniref:DDE Tnp4 domain-containing protein n=1 Tax=Dryococelus australis TaxID=614101 RepID=A0ABQ9HP05_9NEOP|nr:hypothetical protein PR048_012036 [Dryococelus australis]
MYRAVDNEAKKSFLLSCIKEDDKKKRVYTKQQHSRRSRTLMYYLPKEVTTIKVCQQFILKTLDISQRMLQYTFDNQSELHTPKPDMRGRKSPPNKTLQERKEEVEKWIKSLPAVPPHYCHQITNRMYLPVEFKNIRKHFNAIKHMPEKINFFCDTFNFQKVLNTPQGERNIILYYSWMYAVYNFTFYENSTREGLCYLWGECDGKRVAITLNYDSCPGQNKNKQMWSALIGNMSMSISYLIPGHMYMPVDSIHTCSDSFTKKKSIWAPSEWPTIVRNSRIRLGAYNVIVLMHSTFRNWRELQETILQDSKTRSEDNVPTNIV